MAFIKKGHRFFNPLNSEQGYELQKNFVTGDFMKPEYFKPFGVAEIPVDETPVPPWLWEELERIREAPRD